MLLDELFNDLDDIFKRYSKDDLSDNHLVYLDKLFDEIIKDLRFFKSLIVLNRSFEGWDE